MKNTSKAVIRKVSRDLDALKATVEDVQTELDEYIFDNQDTLDGTERGEKLDAELEAIFASLDTFDALKSELLEIVGD